MSDLAIGLLSGAGVTVAVTIALLILALALRSSGKEQTAARVESATLRAQATVDAKTITDLTAAHDSERKRADALEQLLAHATTSVPVDGAYQRLLAQRAKTGRAATEGRTGPAALPAAGTATPVGPGDALERPE